jgi:4-hydroxy-tetrahydrodipicolinate synthase
VFSGDDATAIALMLLGGKGSISVTANVAPALMHQMCAAAIAGDLATAREANFRLLGLAPQPVSRGQSDSGQMGRAADGADRWRHPSADDALSPEFHERVRARCARPASSSKQETDTQ